jgi:choline dehydrogenase-like flavoprotein
MCPASQTAIFGHVTERYDVSSLAAARRRRHAGVHLGLVRHCKAHKVDNLYVVDTSFFPSIWAMDPALTAIANAIRVGDHLLSRMA